MEKDIGELFDVINVFYEKHVYNDVESWGFKGV